MGCLTAAIYTAFLYDIDSSVENKNVEVETSVSIINSIPEVTILFNTPIEVQIDNFNQTPTTSTNFIPQTIETEIYIVCTVSTGETEFLRVIEGNIITIDGQYIKVLKNGI